MVSNRQSESAPHDHRARRSHYRHSHVRYGKQRAITASSENSIQPIDPIHKTFRDRDWTPWMTVIPAGHYLMGSSGDEHGHSANEEPQHAVFFERPFAIGVYPVTCREFASFAHTIEAWPRGALMWTGFEMEHLVDARWDSPGFPQSDMDPVTCVNFEDAKRYVGWLKRTTAKNYRLPSEAEWEYVARAGTTAPYWWGSHISGEKYQGPAERKGTHSVANSSPNPWGLRDVLGNVWEWCEDTWHPNYLGAPTDGSPWTDPLSDRHIVRGGSWSAGSDVLRCAQRRWINGDHRMINVGLRVALTL